MTGHGAYDLHASLGYQLTITARIQQRRLERQLRTLGLTQAGWRILLAVASDGFTSLPAIAGYAGAGRIATARALRWMQRDGLVERGDGDGQAKGPHYRLTESGRATIAAATPMAEASDAVMADMLGHHDMAELKRLLTRLRQG